MLRLRSVLLRSSALCILGRRTSIGWTYRHHRHYYLQGAIASNAATVAILKRSEIHSHVSPAAITTATAATAAATSQTVMPLRRYATGNGESATKRQYRAMLEEQCPPGAILLYQLGNFYEILDACADTVARDTRIPLRQSPNGLAGFPKYRIDQWVPMFLANNLPVVVADQVDVLDADGQPTGTFDRAITRVVTPGTVTAEWQEDPGDISNLLALCPVVMANDGDIAGKATERKKKTDPTTTSTTTTYAMAWTDVNAGKIYVSTCHADALTDDLARIAPTEVVVPSRRKLHNEQQKWSGHLPQPLSLGDGAGAAGAGAVTPEARLAPHALPSTADTALISYYVTAAPTEWCAPPSPEVLAKCCPGAGAHPLVGLDAHECEAVGLLLSYLDFCFRDTRLALARPRPFASHGHMVVPEQVRRTLELTQCAATGRRRESLFGVLDRTSTPLGRRELQHRIQCPLLDVTEINRRLDLVSFFYANRIQAEVRARLGPLCGSVANVAATLAAPGAALAAQLEQLYRLHCVLRAAGHVHILLEAESHTGAGTREEEDSSTAPTATTLAAAMAPLVDPSLVCLLQHLEAAFELDDSQNLDDHRSHGNGGSTSVLPALSSSLSTSLSSTANATAAGSLGVPPTSLLRAGYDTAYDTALAQCRRADAELTALSARYAAEFAAADARFARSDAKKKWVLQPDAVHGAVISTTKAFGGALMQHATELLPLSNAAATGAVATTKSSGGRGSGSGSGSTLSFVSPALTELAAERHAANAALERATSSVANRLRSIFVAARREYDSALDAIADIDVAMSLASVATDKAYCRPVVDNSTALCVRAGRHAVVEDAQTLRQFISNDCTLDGAGERTWILTGANMGGKSTFLRQNALLVIMAQMGAFVPARAAHIGVVDRIFTRIGASDNLAGDMSTFMVEMSEIAQTLHEATARSLVVLDEVGRGTGYLDGVTLSAAIHRYLHVEVGARTLSATHFLPLPALLEGLEGVAAYQMDATAAPMAPPALEEAAVLDENGGIEYFHKVIPGVASGSHGVAVAHLAGCPQPVLMHADELSRLLAPGVASILAPRPSADDTDLDHAKVVVARGPTTFV